MATDDKKYISLQRFKRFAQNMPWQRMRKKMGLGDTLGALPPECGGTGFTNLGSLSSEINKNPDSCTLTLFYPCSSLPEIWSYNSNAYKQWKLPAPAAVDGPRGNDSLLSYDFNGTNPTITINYPGVFELTTQLKITFNSVGPVNARKLPVIVGLTSVNSDPRYAYKFSVNASYQVSMQTDPIGFPNVNFQVARTSDSTYDKSYEKIDLSTGETTFTFSNTTLVFSSAMSGALVPALTANYVSVNGGSGNGFFPTSAGWDIDLEITFTIRRY